MWLCSHCSQYQWWGNSWLINDTWLSSNSEIEILLDMWGKIHYNYLIAFNLWGTQVLSSIDKTSYCCQLVPIQSFVIHDWAMSIELIQGSEQTFPFLLPAIDQCHDFYTPTMPLWKAIKNHWSRQEELDTSGNGEI